MPRRHPGHEAPGRVTWSSHALLCSVIRIDAASRPSTCETSPRNGRCSARPMPPVQRGSTRLPASRAPALSPFSSVRDLVHLDMSVQESPARHNQRPERWPVPARRSPEKGGRLESLPSVRHPPPWPAHAIAHPPARIPGAILPCLLRHQRRPSMLRQKCSSSNAPYHTSRSSARIAEGRSEEHTSELQSLT